eukprot:scaffold100906_cov28-Tisochrysis_lutea.AAC.3
MQHRGASGVSGGGSSTMRVGSRAIWAIERPATASPICSLYSSSCSYPSRAPSPGPLTGMPARSCCSSTICCTSSDSSSSSSARRTTPREFSPSTSRVPRGARPAPRKVIASSACVPYSRRG